MWRHLVGIFLRTSLFNLWCSVSEPTKRSILPLFERLAAELPSQDNGLLETMQSLQRSIGQELYRLFNTRSPLGLTAYFTSGGTVIDYGVPDFSSLSGQNTSDLEKLQTVLTAAICRYEPRLLNAVVQIRPSEERKGLAQVYISADARLGQETHRIEFEMLHDVVAGNAGNAP